MMNHLHTMLMVMMMMMPRWVVVLGNDVGEVLAVDANDTEIMLVLLLLVLLVLLCYSV